MQLKADSWIIWYLYGTYPPFQTTLCNLFWRAIAGGLVIVGGLAVLACYIYMWATNLTLMAAGHAVIGLTAYLALSVDARHERERMAKYELQMAYHRGEITFEEYSSHFKTGSRKWIYTTAEFISHTYLFLKGKYCPIIELTRDDNDN